MYLLLRVLHLAGMALYLGTLLVNRHLKSSAEADGREDVLRFGYQAMRANDLRFGSPGMALLLIGGFGMLYFKMAYMKQGWFHGALGLTVVALGAWMGAQVPAQVKLSKLASMGDPARETLSRRWDLGFWINLVATLAILVLMVGKTAILPAHPQP